MKLKLIFPDLGHFPLVYRRYIPVLGPAILAGLTPPEVEVSFTDERLSTVDIQEDCDLAAISVMTPQAGRAYELSGFYREKGIPVVLGGVHVSLLPEEAQRPRGCHRHRRGRRKLAEAVGRLSAGEGCRRSTAAEPRRKRFPFPGGTSFPAIPISL